MQMNLSLSKQSIQWSVFSTDHRNRRFLKQTFPEDVISMGETPSSWAGFAESYIRNARPDFDGAWTVTTPVSLINVIGKLTIWFFKYIAESVDGSCTLCKCSKAFSMECTAATLYELSFQSASNASNVMLLLRSKLLLLLRNKVARVPPTIWSPSSSKLTKSIVSRVFGWKIASPHSRAMDRI